MASRNHSRRINQDDRPDYRRRPESTTSERGARRLDHIGYVDRGLEYDARSAGNGRSNRVVASDRTHGRNGRVARIYDHGSDVESSSGLSELSVRGDPLVVSMKELDPLPQRERVDVLPSPPDLKESPESWDNYDRVWCRDTEYSLGESVVEFVKKIKPDEHSVGFKIPVSDGDVDILYSRPITSFHGKTASVKKQAIGKVVDGVIVFTIDSKRRNGTSIKALNLMYGFDLTFVSMNPASVESFRKLSSNTFVSPLRVYLKLYDCADTSSVGDLALCEGSKPTFYDFVMSMRSPKYKSKAIYSDGAVLIEDIFYDGSTGCTSYLLTARESFDQIVQRAYSISIGDFDCVRVLGHKCDDHVRLLGYKLSLQDGMTPFSRHMMNEYIAQIHAYVIHPDRVKKVVSNIMGGSAGAELVGRGSDTFFTFVKLCCDLILSGDPIPLTPMQVRSLGSERDREKFRIGLTNVHRSYVDVPLRERILTQICIGGISKYEISGSVTPNFDSVVDAMRSAGYVVTVEDIKAFAESTRDRL
jgi:hypothetical protein